MASGITADRLDASLRASEACLTAGELDLAAAHARQALTCARELDEPQAQLAALWTLGVALASADQVVEAAEIVTEALAAARVVSSVAMVARCQLVLAKLSLNNGEPAAARVALEEVIPLSADVPEPAWFAEALLAIAVDWLHLHEWDDAEAGARTARGLALRASDLRMQAESDLVLGLACLRQGRASEATLYLERAVELFHQIGDREQEGGALADLAEAWREAGHPERAGLAFERGLALALEVGAPDRGDEER